ncbi:MAG: hypothetical protein A2383_01950 [Candidatus Pacebacteria bacterium RIFOXYB1_FULL_39_46]|nr:MAG: hypothetical protein A2182_03465 [Candidatus Pacebacteria bacterium RIFOXYA1_FULL_38_18]OGJ37932.1 MAG: hypothetical protein A2383_01950 [Candidatus Pacebacteria bacterium RIFOXYB1_FULL_39_46]OGJ39530.1 MAG: hypothetical protein A2411_02105 [Candidatus Pacebacteria bacterium RIFOXYC1_FULL_39_21]OGJ40111.1 MAG: hypothetical protein A2582_03395 [Candidatus Pacebacteria bacterium RIFOXYD1_FULL_39_27]
MKNYFQNYFKNLFTSFFDLQVYHRFIQGKTSQAVWHFTISMLLIGIVVGWQIYTHAIPAVREAIDNNLDYLATNYPQDLNIRWDGAQLTTEPEQYHFLAIHPEKLPLFNSLKEDFSGPLLIYTNTNLTMAEADKLLTQHNSIMVIDQNSIFAITDEQEGLRSLVLSEYFDDKQIEINQTNLAQYEQIVKDNLNSWLDLFSKIVFPFFVFGLLLIRLVTSLIMATILWIPARLGKIINTWQQSWRFTLVLSVVVEIIYWISSLLYPDLSFPVYGIAFWVLSLFILLSLKTQTKISSKSKT